MPIRYSGRSNENAEQNAGGFYSRADRHDAGYAFSLAEYLDKTTIDELEARDYHGYEVLEELSADCDILIASAKEVRDEADKADNFQVANLMEEYLDMYAKKSWMIKAMMQDDDLEIADEESDEEDTEEE